VPAKGAYLVKVGETGGQVLYRIEKFINKNMTSFNERSPSELRDATTVLRKWPMSSRRAAKAAENLALEVLHGLGYDTHTTESFWVQEGNFRSLIAIAIATLTRARDVANDFFKPYEVQYDAEQKTEAQPE